MKLDLLKKYEEAIEEVPNAYSKTVFGLVYHRTVTRDFLLWTMISMLMRKRGHRIYIVCTSNPSECLDIPEMLLNNTDGLYVTSGKCKKEHMTDEGIAVDVWIEDIVQVMNHC